jgi:hypothetical protein
MTLTASIGVIGLLLSITSVWADDFSAEVDQAIKMIPITEAQLKDVQALAGD